MLDAEPASFIQSLSVWGLSARLAEFPMGHVWKAPKRNDQYIENKSCQWDCRLMHLHAVGSCFYILRLRSLLKIVMHFSCLIQICFHRHYMVMVLYGPHISLRGQNQASSKGWCMFLANHLARENMRSFMAWLLFAKWRWRNGGRAVVWSTTTLYMRRANHIMIVTQVCLLLYHVHTFFCSLPPLLWNILLVIFFRNIF